MILYAVFMTCYAIGISACCIHLIQVRDRLIREREDNA